MSYQAVILAVPNFAQQMTAIQQGLNTDFPDSAHERYEALCGALKDLCPRLSKSPYSSRNLQLPKSVSPAVSMLVTRIKDLAKDINLPNLKEVILVDYVVFLAHSEKRVVLLSIQALDSLKSPST